MLIEINLAVFLCSFSSSIDVEIAVAVSVERKEMLEIRNAWSHKV